MIKLKNKLHLSDEGFSLMELVVTMLVSAVVVAAATGFLVAGVQFYNRANAETVVQTESQVAELFLTEMIQESEEHRFVVACPTGVDSALIVDRNEVEIDASTGAEIELESVVIRKGSQLWYGTAKKSDPDDVKIALIAAKEKKDAFLADCVTDFMVIDHTGNGLVQVVMEFEEGNKTYSGNAIIALRNKKKN